MVAYSAGTENVLVEGKMEMHKHPELYPQEYAPQQLDTTALLLFTTGNH